MMDRRKYDGTSFSERLDYILEQQTQILRNQEEIVKAFPYGIEHHKQEHIIREQARKSSEDFLNDLKRTLAKNIILAFLALSVSLILLGIFTKSVDFIQGVLHVQ